MTKCRPPAVRTAGGHNSRLVVRCRRPNGTAGDALILDLPVAPTRSQDAYTVIPALTTIDDVEFATMGCTDWFNQRRLHSTLNYLTPDEFEEVYYCQETAFQPEMSQP